MTDPSESKKIFYERFQSFSEVHYRAIRCADDNTLAELKEAMRQLSAVATGRDFTSCFRHYSEAVAGAMTLTTELGRAKRLMREGHTDFGRLTAAFENDERAKRSLHPRP